MFAALGCITRLELVSRLSDGEERSITDLTKGLGLTRQAVTKHLQVLQDAGLVQSKRVGRESRYTIQARPIRQAEDYLSRIASQWDDAIARLRDRVEE